MTNRERKTSGTKIKRVIRKIVHLMKNSLFVPMIITLGLILSNLFVSTSVSFAQDNPPVIREIRVMKADRTGINQPMGLVFSSRLNAFYVLDAREWRRSPTVADLVGLTVFEDRIDLARIEAAIQDPINMVYDNKVNRLLILQAQGNQLLEVLADQNGKLDLATLTRHNVVYFGVQNPQGLTLDPVSGDLFILDAAGPRIVRISGALDNGTVSVLDLGSSGIATPRGIAFDPSTGHLHVVSQSEKKLFELTQSGDRVAMRDLTGFGLQNPQEIVFAPSSDQTDDSSQINLFLADSGQNDVQATSDSQGTGQIVELSLTQPVVAAAATFISSIVKTTDLSKVSPPSPDPSGLTYWPSRNSLVMSDGEVEETVNNITHWQGANVWELTLNGAVVRTADISRRFSKVVPMTDEPTGVAWNPNNGHFYFTDDGMKEVFDLNPGGDGWIGTADDTWTHFAT